MEKSSQTFSDKLNSFYKELKVIHHLDGIKALLDWDQQTFLPPDGEDARASQIETISVLRHQKILNPILKQVATELLSQIEEQNPKDIFEHTTNLKWVLKTINREQKFSSDFVARRARAHAECFQVWQQAKKESNFNLVKPIFSQVLDLYKEEANLIGFKDHIYDALLDQYEPEAQVAWLRPLLLELAKELPSIIQNRKDIQQQSNLQRKKFPMPIDCQIKLCNRLMQEFGLPPSASRLDKSSHPFCTTIGAGDVRITTRYDENDFLYGLSSVMHELGHALYEYNQPAKWRGTASGEVYSLGLHESQSRFIENIVGRSRQFCNYLAKAAFEESNIKYDPNDLYDSMNYINPSLIRVDADEVTYSLHVVIRMELELLLLEEKITIDDLVESWNQKYQEYLGVPVTSEKEGILQDVHWFSGAFGYFPTYVLGNIYGGSMLEAALKQIPDFWQDIESGKFSTIVDWLNKNIHQHGSKFSALDLVRNITKEETISIEPFCRYLQNFTAA